MQFFTFYAVLTFYLDTLG